MVEIATTPPPSELEFDDVDGWNTDSDAEGYLVYRIVSNKYRDAGRADGCDVPETFAETYFARKLKVGRRAMRRFRRNSAQEFSGACVCVGDFEHMAIGVWRRKDMLKFRNRQVFAW